MGAEWRTVAFNDFMAIRTRNGIHKGPSFQGHGVPVVKMGEVYHADVVQDQSRDLLDLTPDELNRLDLEEGDLLFCRTSLVADGVGHCALVGALSRRSTFASNLIRVRLNPKRAVPRYWFYYFRSPVGKPQLLSRARGTSVTTITGPDIAALEVTAPDVPEQRAIAHILGALDDKIELNRRMNETLEQIPLALFKSWFVDFDPVRAKSEGRDTGLPSEIADLFPDSFEDSDLGEIPKGWEVVSLDQMASIHGGKQLPTEECRASGTFPVYGANGIMGYTDRATHEGFAIAFGRVGAYCGSIHWVYNGAWVNNNASAVVPPRWSEFVLESMLDFDFDSLRTGSAQPFIPNSAMASAAVIRPSGEILDAFCATVRSLRLKQEATKEQSATLASVRDAFLPKLVSGELRVNGTERFLEART